MKNRILCHSPWTMALFSSILLSGCGIPAEPSQTIMTITNPNISNDLLLPAELLYLFQGQIWQLSTDGRNTTQITNEIDPVTSFDVSPATDYLVYISGNQLILSRGDGSQRKILRQGNILSAHTDLKDQLNDEEWIQNRIHSPMFSSNGNEVAFVENGLKQINLNDQSIKTIWENHKDSDTVFSQLMSWSPDDKKFLVSIYEFPTQSIYKQSIGLVTRESLITLRNQPVDGFSWFSGGSGIILSDSLIAYADSLIRCELNRVQCIEIAEFEPGHWFYAYKTPMVINNNSINVFMSAVSDPSIPPNGFKLIQVSLEGRNRTYLMEEEFPVEFGLWAKDGQGVIIQLSSQMQSYSAGSVLWLELVQKEIFELPVTNISQMKWRRDEVK